MLYRIPICREIKISHLPNIACHISNCIICTRAKMRHLFRGTNSGAYAIGMPQIDRKSATEVVSTHEHKYFVIIVEEFTRFEAVRPISNKGRRSRQMSIVRSLLRDVGRIYRQKLVIPKVVLNSNEHLAQRSIAV